MEDLQNPRNTELAGGEQSSVRHQTQGTHALYITGAVLEKGLDTLKDFADLVPMAPGLGPALGIVCGCIKVYHVNNSSVGHTQ